MTLVRCVGAIRRIQPRRHRLSTGSSRLAVANITRAESAADGTPVCWGDRHAVAPPGESLSAISIGVVHTCALRQDGSPDLLGHRL